MATSVAASSPSARVSPLARGGGGRRRARVGTVGIGLRQAGARSSGTDEHARRQARHGAVRAREVESAEEGGREALPVHALGQGRRVDWKSFTPSLFDG